MNFIFNRPDLLHSEYTSLLLPGNRAYLVVFCNSNVHRRCIKKFSTKCVNNPQPFPWRKRGWVYFWSQIKACGCSLCEVRCCNAEKPVPGNNIVRQDCSGEHGELRDGQRCNVVGVASKELLPYIKWALLLKHPNIGGATQARTSLPWFLRPGLHTVRKIFLNKEFLSRWEMRLPQKWALHDDSNDTQQLYVVSHAKTFTVD